MWRSGFNLKSDAPPPSKFSEIDIPDVKVRTCLDKWKKSSSTESSSSLASESSLPPPIHEPPSLLPHSTLDCVKKARQHAVLFDTSFRRLLFLTGRDACIVGDHFLTCNLRKMRTGDASYSCILDTKGNVLDSGFVVKGYYDWEANIRFGGDEGGADVNDIGRKSNNSSSSRASTTVLILSEGHHGIQLYNYLSSYVTYAK